MCLKSFTICCFSVLLLWNVRVIPGDSFAQSEDLTLELSMLEFDPAAEKLIVQLRVVNTGMQPLVLPRLQEGMLERYGVWGGWWMFAVKCPPLEAFSYRRRGSPEPTEEDLIVLEPGEYFSVTRNLVNVRPTSADYRKKYRHADSFDLGVIEGEYEVVFGFRTPEKTFPRELKERIWQGETRSQTLTFVLTAEQPRIYFPGKQSSLASPDGQYQVVNGPEHRLSLYDMHTGTQEKLYSYAQQAEVLWSPESGRLLINDYACDKIDKHETFPLIVLVEQRTVRNLRDELQRHLGDKLGKSAYIMGTEWRTEDTLLVRNMNYGLEQGPSYFIDDNNQIVLNPDFDWNYIQWYEYDVPSGRFTRVE